MNWQVEAENRFIEAAVVRAMEEKHESESKVMDLQHQVRWSQPNTLFFSTSADMQLIAQRFSD